MNVFLSRKTLLVLHGLEGGSQKGMMRKTKLGPKRGDDYIVTAGHYGGGAAPGKLGFVTNLIWRGHPEGKGQE